MVSDVSPASMRSTMTSIFLFIIASLGGAGPFFVGVLIEQLETKMDRADATRRVCFS